MERLSREVRAQAIPGGSEEILLGFCHVDGPLLGKESRNCEQRPSIRNVNSNLK